MKKVETLGSYNLITLNGWLPIKKFCEVMPYDIEKVKNLRNSGKWLDGVITKCLGKEIWVNVWEVKLYNERHGLTY